MPEPGRLDEAAAQWRRHLHLLVLAGDPRNKVSGGLFAARLTDTARRLPTRMLYGASAKARRADSTREAGCGIG